MESAALNLTGQMLISMPDMGDSRFTQSLVFICNHDESGAMGLIVNKPLEGMFLTELLEQLSLSGEADVATQPLFYGGPVENNRGFVLHSGEYRSSIATLAVGEDFAMTATQDVLEDIAGNNGPKNALIALGYAGWGPRQLESEIARNGWLTCPARPELVFSPTPQTLWQDALLTIGASALTLSSEAGRA